ncbi:hypothetical protein CR513_19396, partial [Mucuna pruriens]
MQSLMPHVTSNYNATIPSSPTPLFVEELKPKGGKLFDTLEESKIFYRRYAHNVGFSVLLIRN